MRRRQFLTLLGGAASAWPLPLRAQQKSVLVGFLAAGGLSSVSEQLTGIRRGLAESGFVEGKNLALETRFAEGVYDRLPEMAADLVARKVDLIVAQAPPAAHAAKAATTTIPITFGVGIDPVSEGLVASLARPGANLTGVTLLSSELMAKRFDLMTEIVPGARYIALLMNPNNANPWTGSVEAASRAKGVRLLALKATTVAEIDEAFTILVQERAQALVIGEDTFLAQRPQVAELALRHAIPAIGILHRFAASGGLISYGTNVTAAYRQIGILAGKILQGAKPADLAVQQPTKFELVLNLKTAKVLGLTIPPLLLAQADEVIE